jgi:hypothetical protein
MTIRRLLFTTCLTLGIASPAAAQLPVTDVANLVQTILIAARTQAHYQALLAQYQTVLRLAAGLGSMEGYRIPPIASTRHDSARWEYGRPWLQGLNAGDPAGAGYWSSARPLARPGALLDQLPTDARRVIERAYATIEIADSVAFMGGHQIGALRGYTDRLQQGVQELEQDVLNGLERYHELTANLDKIAGAELLGRRQDTATNQLLSHTLEQLLIRGKRLRDAEVAVMNMRLRGIEGDRELRQQLIGGSGEALRAWRQP